MAGTAADASTSRTITEGLTEKKPYFSPLYYYLFKALNQVLPYQCIYKNGSFRKSSRFGVLQRQSNHLLR